MCFVVMVAVEFLSLFSRAAPYSEALPVICLGAERDEWHAQAPLCTLHMFCAPTTPWLWRTCFESGLKSKLEASAQKQLRRV
jgi:hypothetical protein